MASQGLKDEIKKRNPFDSAEQEAAPNLARTSTVSRCPVWRSVHRPALRFGAVPPRGSRPWSAASRSSHFRRQPSFRTRTLRRLSLAHCVVSYVVSTILDRPFPPLTFE